MGQRACSNPLCEHFYRMVGDDHQFFAWELIEPLPPAPSNDKEFSEVCDLPVKRLGRTLYQWVVAEEDHYEYAMPWTAKWVWTYSHERASEYLTEWYYFCDHCHDVLEGSKL